MSDQINVITQQIESKFNDIENKIFSGSMFSQWRGSFEVKKVYLKKENADIKCDLDIRLKNWPEGVYIKVYKHKALCGSTLCKRSTSLQRSFNYRAYAV
ncbi:MAG: hypothetical protein RPS47_17365 [Colwellia sp.]